MSQRRGLGRGLGALLGESPLPQQAQADHQMREIPVENITPNPFQPRKSFDPVALNELQMSIAEYGVLVPIIVRERGERFELVAGERRWRASAALQKATIPAVVRGSDDRDSLEVALVENVQREDLNALEEAAGFAQLMDEYAFTQEQLAERLAKSRPAIANALRLLLLEDAIKAMIVDGRLTAGHARALLAAPAQNRLSLAERAISEGLSVRSLERSAAALANPGRPQGAPNSRPLSPDQVEFESQLRTKLGAHVALRRKGKGGKIEIRYASESDLIRIAEALLGTTG